MTSFEISCNLCSNESFQVIEDEENPFQVLKCRQCSLVFVHPQPNVRELESHYDDHYYRKWMGEQKQKRCKMWKRRLDRLEKFCSKGNLLDVGCGEGSFLKLAKQKGWTVKGTEFSPFAAQYAADLLNTNIFCGDLTDAGYPENCFDVVTLWHVLEHVPDPERYLKTIHEILQPGGLLVLAVPNVNNLMMKLAYRIVKRQRLKLFHSGEKELHLFHFSPKTIRSYLKKTGFDCLKLSPDFGIIDRSKKLVNLLALVPYYLTGVKIFNALEIYALSQKDI